MQHSPRKLTSKTKPGSNSGKKLGLLASALRESSATPNQQLARNARGSLMAELMCTIPLMSAVGLFMLNTGAFFYGACINDTACRAAARAAANCSSQEEAVQAAQEAIRTYQSSSSLYTVSIPPNSVTYQTFSIPGKGPDLDKGPFVKVTIRTQVKAVVPIDFHGATSPEEVKFEQSYTYPILNLPQT